ncbi:MAG: hypothetical protein HQK91_07775 [Nitrospirae bacterium]|nr:hypothetical protein [Nitrospirota bacterium]
MDFTIEQKIALLSPYCICRFKDTTHDKSAHPHYYVYVPCSIKDKFILCIFTSRIIEKNKYYSKTNEKALQSLIYIDNTDIDFLDRKTIIECNQAEIFTQKSLLYRIEKAQGFEILSRTITDELKDKIIDGIKNSPMVKGYIKKSV